MKKNKNQLELKKVRIEKSSQAYIYPLIHVYKKNSSSLNYSHQMKLVDIKIDFLWFNLVSTYNFLTLQPKYDNFLCLLSFQGLKC